LTVSVENPVVAPPWWRTLAEGRAAFELGAFFAASPALRLIGRGDRHPVLVLPGFTTSDLSTEPLRWFLRSQGYWAHGWHLGTNLGPTKRMLDGLEERFQYVHQRHHRKISLVGWSLGGIYARMLAQQHPDMVRQVITLGSPFRLEAGDHTALDPIWNRVAPGFAPELARLRTNLVDDLAVPSTAIYSKSDGIVDWHTCVETTGGQRESIEVFGSHSGLGFNPAALLAVSDRLRYDDQNWKPFRPPRGSDRLFGQLTSRQPV
jgi:pimeloyl-ACP methyl ester carboxylesterase